MSTHHPHSSKFLVLVLIFLIPVQGFAASTRNRVRYTRYENERYGFSFQCPKDWSVNEYPNSEILTVHISSLTHLPRISVVTGPLANPDATLEEVAEETIEVLHKNRPFLKIKEYYDITVAGLPARRLSVVDINKQGLDVSSIEVITKKDGRTYVFMFNDLTDNSNDNVFIFERMLKTLELASTESFTEHFQAYAFNFEFDYPEGWDVNQYMQGGMSEFVINVSPPSYPSHIALIQRKLKKEVTLDDLEQELEAHTSGEEIGVSRTPIIRDSFKLRRKSSVQQGKSGPELVAEYEGKTKEDAPLTAVNYLSVGRGRYMYTFKYWVVEGDLDVYRNTLPAIIESVNFTDDQQKQSWLPPQSFTDVPVEHPYFGSIEYMKKMDWVRGYEDGTYKPENHINRAEFTKILIHALFPQDIDPDPVTCIEDHANGEFLFSDVDLRSWFSAPVCTAKVKGLIQGYPDGTFHPERNIDFAEAAKIVALAFHAEQQTDNVWYRPYVRFLADRKAIPPSIASFDAKLTRGEIAEVIYRVRTGAEGNSLTYEQLQSQ